MRRAVLVLCFVVVCMALTVAGCSIRILPSFQESDGYDPAWNTGGGRARTERKTIVWEATEAMVDSVLARNEYTWILLAAPWCPRAIVDMERLSDQRNELEVHGVTPLVVTGDYRLGRMVLGGFFSDRVCPVVVLGHTGYGDNVFEKENCFLKTLGMDHRVNAAYPVHVLVDAEKRIVFSKTGTITDPLSVLRQLESEGDWKPVTTCR